jgi:predicted Zn-dependent protease
MTGVAGTSAATAAGLATGALDTAERIVELVRTKDASADAEVTVRTGTDALTRFANGFIHQNVAEEINNVLLRVATDGRVAASSLDGPATESALRRLIDNVFDAARVRPVDPDWPGLAPISEAPSVDHWDDATAMAGPDERAERVRHFVAAGGGLETAGFCSTTAVTVAFANSAGQRLSGRSTAAALDGIARTATSDGSGRALSGRLSDIDGSAIGDAAARRAHEGSDPTDIEPGRYEVVLGPSCVADVLQFLFIFGLNGLPVHEGRSFARPGEAQFDPSISIRDDATDPRQVGVAFDVEGTPRRSVDVVRNGVTRTVLQSRRTARKMGVQSTGHGAEGAEAWGAIPSNIVLEPGPRTSDELVAGVERGLLVTDFWYTRILDPRTEVVTGLTRNGVWLIEDGRVVRPVKNMRFTQSYIEALGPGAVKAIGSDASLVQAGFDIASLVPSLHLASWNFTGGAQG